MRYHKMIEGIKLHHGPSEQNRTTAKRKSDRRDKKELKDKEYFKKITRDTIYEVLRDEEIGADLFSYTCSHTYTTYTNHIEPSKQPEEIYKLSRFIDNRTGIMKVHREMIHYIDKNYKGVLPKSCKITISPTGSIYISHLAKQIRISDHIRAEESFRDKNIVLTILCNKDGYCVMTKEELDNLKKTFFTDMKYIGLNEKTAFREAVKNIPQKPTTDGFQPIIDALDGFFDPPGPPSTTPLGSDA